MGWRLACKRQQSKKACSLHIVYPVPVLTGTRSRCALASHLGCNDGIDEVHWRGAEAQEEVAPPPVLVELADQATDTCIVVLNLVNKDESQTARHLSPSYTVPHILLSGVCKTISAPVASSDDFGHYHSLQKDSHPGPLVTYSVQVRDGRKSTGQQKKSHDRHKALAMPSTYVLTSLSALMASMVEAIFSWAFMGRYTSMS